jgi:hypothetical protein
MATADRQRWARVPPHLAWKHPGLPRQWTPVLERNEEALAGHVWLEAAPQQNKRFHTRGAPRAPGRPALTDPEHEVEV